MMLVTRPRLSLARRYRSEPARRGRSARPARRARLASSAGNRHRTQAEGTS